MMDTTPRKRRNESNRSDRVSNILATVTLVFAIVFAAGSLPAIWAAHAPSDGERDIGKAVVVAYALISVMWGSWGVAAFAAFGTILARASQAPIRRWILALTIALIPTACLYVADLF